MTALVGVNDVVVHQDKLVGLAKSPTGVEGLDSVTGGGLPEGRTTLVAGGPGCGKSLLAVEFLVRGALDFGEPGVLVAFDEATADISANVSSFGHNLDRMRADGLLTVLDGAEVVETAAFDLNRLFLRLGLEVDAIGAKRVVLDSIDVLFATLGKDAMVRDELRRLFDWLKAQGLTAVVTSEKGDGQITRNGIEEYISDCVITLDHRVHEQISTRRLRIVKYRGSTHDTSELPFLITDRGITVLPLTSAHLDYETSSERISTGIPGLDSMLGGGVFAGSSVLVSGEAGSGKSTIAAKMLETACARGERALFVSFEESSAQLIRNMASVGIDLGGWKGQGLLRLWAARPSAYGLENHLASLVHLIADFEPSIVAIDAMTSLSKNSVTSELTSLITRELDLMKSRGITAILTELFRSGEENTDAAMTSLMDTSLFLRNFEINGENNRLLSVRKSRGSAHSNQVREFVMTDHGLDFVDVVMGPEGAVFGSARVVLEAERREAAARRAVEHQRRRVEFARRSREVDAQVHSLQQALEEERAEIERLEAEANRQADVVRFNDDALNAYQQLAASLEAVQDQ